MTTNAGLADFFKEQIRKGADVKFLQYEENMKSYCDTQINLTKIIHDRFYSNQEYNSQDAHCLMINIEECIDRYRSTREELKKINITNFVHLKATYWKDKANFQDDLTFVMQFLKQYNLDIYLDKITINDFSECNDKKIEIQDGPLACYCSHLRAMIYGFLNFNDYTIIVEDDLLIADTALLEKYIKCIPDDWDIIYMNSAPKHKIYNEPYYRFTEEFHSCHFYIIKNKRMPEIFEHMYPVFEQVDVLIAKLIHKLNIYNIADVCYQKNYSTDTQNNLNVIFNSTNYDYIRGHINIIRTNLTYFCNKFLPNNDKNNDILVSQLMYENLFLFILNNKSSMDTKYIDNINKENYISDNLDDITSTPEYEALFNSIYIFLIYTKKGINIKETAASLLNAMLFIIKKFTLHMTIDHDTQEELKALSFGSTSQTYILEKNNIVIKQYNDKLRWLSEDHDNSQDIFNKEIEILQKLNKIDINQVNLDKKLIRLKYEGVSLHTDFNLPEDWKEQIKNIFDNLTNNNIYYPEFKLENILVLDNKISFIDYGLASNKVNLASNQVNLANNQVNYNKFIDLLDKLNDKFKNITDREKRYELYHIFMQNVNN